LSTPALIVSIILMAYSFTAQLFPAAVAAFYTKLKPGSLRLLAGFGAALIFVLRIVAPPFNIHPGILGLAVNLTVLLIALAIQSVKKGTAQHPALDWVGTDTACVRELAIAHSVQSD
jgi:hypothetical protein